MDTLWRFHEHGDGPGGLLRPVPRVAVILGGFVPCLVLAGWTLDIAALQNVLPGQPRMVPNTALTFILSSIALWLSGGAQTGVRGRRAARVLAGLVVLVSLLTLCEYATGADFGIDGLLFAEKVRANGESFPGRPSPHTAVSFLLVGLALLLLSLKARRAVHLAQTLAIAVALVALIALVGYGYRVTNLYSISAYTGMALHTALTFVALAAGILFARPRGGLMAVVTSDTVGGQMARRLLPAAMAVPVVVGGLILVGARRGLYDTSFGMALCVVASIVALAFLIWRNASALYRTDTGRRQAEDALRKAHDGLEVRVAERTAELSKVNETLQSEVVGHKRAEASRVQLLRQLVTAQEEERRRLSRELHDHMGQHLSALMLRLKTLQTVPPGDGRFEADIVRLQELTDQLVREAHHLAWELRPAALDDLGLQTAVSNYAEKWSERCGVAVDFHGSGLERARLPPEVETNVYRIVQEALTNVLKHADARRVSLILERRRDHLLVIVEDDGRGFDVGVVVVAREGGATGGLGLLGMQERVALSGGTLKLESEPGAGTTIVIRIPVPSSVESEVFPREHTTHRPGGRPRRLA